MDDLLTTRQVQDILKVDRITIYRMLQDGRLKGIKIGQQWRFPASQVNRLLSQDAPLAASLETNEAAQNTARRGSFPVHCVQVIQDLYAGLGKIGAVTVDPCGAPLTEPSQPCRFCALLQSSPTGREACRRSWENAVSKPGKPGWQPCHAGLYYFRAPILENGVPVAFLLTGPVCLTPSETQEETENINALASQHGLDAADLLQAAREVPVCVGTARAEMETWPAKYTRAVESILAERAGLVGKLQKIAEISAQ